jgi:hypothetical protein
VIAFVLALLREWREERMRRTISVSVVILAAAALAGPLQPLLLALAGTAVFVVSGWADGNSPRPAHAEGVDALSFQARARALVSGRILAALALWLGLVLALSPILAASAIAWGLSSSLMLSCLLCWLTAYLTGTSAGFCSKLVFSGSDGLVGLLIYLLWVLSSFFAAPLKSSNPFIQAWSLLRLEGGSAPYSGICAEAIAAAILFAASALVLSAGRRKRNA